MPEECQVDGDGAEDRTDDPRQPEEPSPGGTQRGEYSEGEKAKQERECPKISVVGGLTELACSVHEIEQEAEAECRREEREQPGCDYAPTCELEDGAGEEKNDCEPAEESCHRNASCNCG